MARRDEDDDDADAYEEKPRRKPPRPESIQPAKPRRPPPPDDDDDEEVARSKPRRRPRDDDDEDDRPRRRARRDEDDDYEEDRPRRRKGGAIIPYRNGPALASYYCGFGGLILILGSIALAAIMAPNINHFLIFTMMYGGGGICGLLAVIFGIAGCIKANRDPEARGTAHAIIGMVLGAVEIIGLIVIMIIGLAIFR